MNFEVCLELESLSCTAEHSYCLCHSYDSRRGDPDARGRVRGLGAGTLLSTCTPLLVDVEALQTMLTGVYGSHMHTLLYTVVLSG